MYAAHVSKGKAKSSLNPFLIWQLLPTPQAAEVVSVGTQPRKSAPQLPHTPQHPEQGAVGFIISVSPVPVHWCGFSMHSTEAKQGKAFGILWASGHAGNGCVPLAKGESWCSKTCCLMFLRRGVCVGAVVWLKHLMYQSTGSFAY